MKSSLDNSFQFYTKICSIHFQNYLQLRVVDAEAMKDIAYDDLVKILSEHYHDPVLSSIVQRYKFYNHNRKDGESIANFVATPREIAKFCDYKETLNMMLRDCLVCGVTNRSIQTWLLAEKELTFEKALEIALSVDAAEKDVAKADSNAEYYCYVSQTKCKSITTKEWIWDGYSKNHSYYHVTQMSSQSPPTYISIQEGRMVQMSQEWWYCKSV